MFIGLKPKAERDPAPVMIARLRQKTSQIPGMQTFFQSIQNLNVGGRISKSQYQYTLQSSDIEQPLRDRAARCWRRSRRFPACST